MVSGLPTAFRFSLAAFSLLGLVFYSAASVEKLGWTLIFFVPGPIDGPIDVSRFHDRPPQAFFDGPAFTNLRRPTRNFFARQLRSASRPRFGMAAGIHHAPHGNYARQSAQRKKPAFPIQAICQNRCSTAERPRMPRPADESSAMPAGIV